MERVLLLNASYEPLQLVTARRAILMLISNRADAVATHDDPRVFRSPSFEIPIPSVVRLRTYVKIPYQATLPPLSRRAVLIRDRHRCAYCDGPADTVDHVIPRSRGGTHEWLNVVACCKAHNLKKGNRLLSEIGWELLFQPVVPVGMLWKWRHLGEADPLWAQVLGEAVNAA